MATHFVPIRYHSYSDTLTAVGYAVLIASLYGVDEGQVYLRTVPGGFQIEYPDGEPDQENNPFAEIRDKEDRLTFSLNVYDKTAFAKKESKPHWWGTISVINMLASPEFNNKIAQLYSADLGRQMLTENPPKLKLGGMSQLLFAQASKGVNSAKPATTQGNLEAGYEQVIAHLGYQYGAAGFSRDPYTFSIVPRPRNISLRNYLALLGSQKNAENQLRGYYPRSMNGKILPTSDQTLPYFLAMAYFDFLVQLFNYSEHDPELAALLASVGAGALIESFDQAVYVSMGSASAPYRINSFTIPTWLTDKSVVTNVRDVVRQTLGDQLDPRMLYLPIRAFAEGNPRLLLRFYRLSNPLRERRTLLTQHTIAYLMEKTGFNDLNCEAMQHFARAIRSRTLKKLYAAGEQPDFSLLTELKSAALNSQRLVSVLSAFVGSYNLRNARQTTDGKKPDGQNLSYDDLQVIVGLIERYEAEFIVNTLLAQAMSKKPTDTESAVPKTEE